MALQDKHTYNNPPAGHVGILENNTPVLIAHTLLRGNAHHGTKPSGALILILRLLVHLQRQKASINSSDLTKKHILGPRKFFMWAHKRRHASWAGLFLLSKDIKPNSSFPSHKRRPAKPHAKIRFPSRNTPHKAKQTRNWKKAQKKPTTEGGKKLQVENKLFYGGTGATDKAAPSCTKQRGGLSSDTGWLDNNQLGEIMTYHDPSTIPPTTLARLCQVQSDSSLSFRETITQRLLKHGHTQFAVCADSHWFLAMLKWNSDKQIISYVYDPLGIEANPTATNQIKVTLTGMINLIRGKLHITGHQSYITKDKYQVDDFNCGVWVVKAAHRWLQWNRSTTDIPFSDYLKQDFNEGHEGLDKMKLDIQRYRTFIRNETLSMHAAATPSMELDDDVNLHPQHVNSPPHPPQNHITRKGALTVSQMKRLLEHFNVNWLLHENAEAMVNELNRSQSDQQLNQNSQPTPYFTHLINIKGVWFVALHIIPHALVLHFSQSHNTNSLFTRSSLAMLTHVTQQRVDTHFGEHPHNSGLLMFTLAQTASRILISHSFHSPEQLTRDIINEMKEINIHDIRGNNCSNRQRKMENDATISHIRYSLRRLFPHYKHQMNRLHMAGQSGTSGTGLQANVNRTSNQITCLNKTYGFRRKYQRKHKRKNYGTKCVNENFNLENIYDGLGRCLSSGRTIAPRQRKTEIDRLTHLQKVQISDNIVIMGMNMRGLRHAQEDKGSLLKLETICNLMIDGRADIVCISETKINNDNVALIKTLMAQKGIQYRTSYTDERASIGAMILWNPRSMPLAVSATRIDGDAKRAVMIKFVGKKGFELYVASGYMNDASLQEEQETFYSTLVDWAAKAGENPMKAFIEIGDKNCNLTQNQRVTRGVTMSHQDHLEKNKHLLHYANNDKCKLKELIMEHNPTENVFTHVISKNSKAKLTHILANNTMAEMTMASGWTEENPYIISDHGIVWAEFKLPSLQKSTCVHETETVTVPRFSGAKEQSHEGYAGYPVCLKTNTTHAAKQAKLSKKMVSAFLTQNGYTKSELVHACIDRERALREITTLSGDTTDLDIRKTNIDGTPISSNKLTKVAHKLDHLEQGLKWHNKSKEWWVHFNSPWYAAHLLSRGKNMPENAQNLDFDEEENSWLIGLPNA